MEGVILIILGLLCAKLFAMVIQKVEQQFKYKEITNAEIISAKILIVIWLFVCFGIYIFLGNFLIVFYNSNVANTAFDKYTIIVVIIFVFILLPKNHLKIIKVGKPIKVTKIFHNGQLNDKMESFTDILPEVIEIGKPIIFKKDVCQISNVKRILNKNPKKIIIETQTSLYEIERV